MLRVGRVAIFCEELVIERWPILRGGNKPQEAQIDQMRVNRNPSSIGDFRGTRLRRDPNKVEPVSFYEVTFS